MYKYAAIVVILIISLSGITANDSLLSEISAKMVAAESVDEIIDVVKEYTTIVEDVDLLRRLQDVWIESDKEGYESYYETLYKDYPDSKVFHYLWARCLERGYEQQKEARKLIKLYPDFRYGYLLLAYLYNYSLFPEDKDNVEDSDELLLNFQTDQQLLLSWYEKFPEDSDVIYTMFSMNLWQKNFEKAEEFLLMTKDIPSTWVNYFLIFDFSMKSGRLSAFRELFPAAIQLYIEQGAVSQADSLSLYAGYYINILQVLKKWEMLEAYIDETPEIENESYALRALVNINIENERYDKAVKHLTNLLDAGHVNYETIKNNQQWAVLSETPGWDSLLALAKTKWDEGKENR